MGIALCRSGTLDSAAGRAFRPPGLLRPAALHAQQAWVPRKRNLASFDALDDLPDLSSHQQPQAAKQGTAPQDEPQPEPLKSSSCLAGQPGAAGAVLKAAPRKPFAAPRLAQRLAESKALEVADRVASLPDKPSRSSQADAQGGRPALPAKRHSSENHEAGPADSSRNRLQVKPDTDAATATGLGPASAEKCAALDGDDSLVEEVPDSEESSGTAGHGGLTRPQRLQSSSAHRQDAPQSSRGLQELSNAGILAGQLSPRDRPSQGMKTASAAGKRLAADRDAGGRSTGRKKLKRLYDAPSSLGRSQDAEVSLQHTNLARPSASPCALRGPATV